MLSGDSPPVISSDSDRHSFRHKTCAGLLKGTEVLAKKHFLKSVFPRIETAITQNRQKIEEKNPFAGWPVHSMRVGWFLLDDGLGGK